MSNMGNGKERVESPVDLIKTAKLLTRLQRAVLMVVLLLIASQIMALLYTLVGFSVGIVGAVFTIAVSWFATRKAKQGAKSTAWFMLPPILFTGIPLVLKFFPGEEEQSVSLQYLLLSNLPFVFGFLLPVIILLLLYWRLGRYLESFPHDSLN